MIETRYGAATDVGAVREHNEDAVLAVPAVYAVADGMGGHAAGEVAARIALNQLAELAGNELHPDEITRALAAANDAILQAVAADPRTTGMGTTVVGACLTSVGGSPHWLTFNIGDSRVYRFDGKALIQVSTDHSEVEELVMSGQITREQARSHPRRHVITRSLGTDPGPVADIWMFPAMDGERLLLCSDGLTSELEDEAIAEQLAAGSPEGAANRLVAMAVAAGGHDNVSVVIVELCGAPTVDPAAVTTQPRVALDEG